MFHSPKDVKAYLGSFENRTSYTPLPQPTKAPDGKLFCKNEFACDPMHSTTKCIPMSKVCDLSKFVKNFNTITRELFIVNLNCSIKFSDCDDGIDE